VLYGLQGSFAGAFGQRAILVCRSEIVEHPWDVEAKQYKTPVAKGPVALLKRISIITALHSTTVSIEKRFESSG
jgi:hypothetical protein